jgi:hypothetical protein
MEEQNTNAGQGLGIAGLILGIIALIIAFIPCIGLLALVPGAIAIVLSAIGLSQAKKANAPKGLITAALVIAIVGTSIALIWGLVLSSASTTGYHLFKKMEKSIEKETGKSMEDAFKDWGDEMESTMRDLEDSADSGDFDGSELSEEQFDELLTSYESLINEYLKFATDFKKGTATAIAAYAKLAPKTIEVAGKLSASYPYLTPEQVKKFEDLQKKYEKALESVE